MSPPVLLPLGAGEREVRFFFPSYNARMPRRTHFIAVALTSFVTAVACVALAEDPAAQTAASGDRASVQLFKDKGEPKDVKFKTYINERGLLKVEALGEIPKANKPK